MSNPEVTAEHGLTPDLETKLAAFHERQAAKDDQEALNLWPLLNGDRVLVEPVRPTRTKSGIITPQSQEIEANQVCRILGCGPAVPSEYAPGQLVMVDATAFASFTVGNRRVVYTVHLPDISGRLVEISDEALQAFLNENIIPDLTPRARARGLYRLFGGEGLHAPARRQEAVRVQRQRHLRRLPPGGRCGGLPP